jgi:hypothetical protein
VLLTLIPDPLPRSVGNAHTDRDETRFELPFVPVRQVMFCHLASARMFSAGIDKYQESSADADGRAWRLPDQLYVDGVRLEMARNANRPSQATRSEPLPERRAQSVPGICEIRSISASGISGFVRSAQCSAGTPTRFKRARPLV